VKRRKTKKKSLQKDLTRLDNLFRHLKEIKHGETDTKEKRNQPSRLKDQFKNIFSFIRTLNTKRDHSIFKNAVIRDYAFLSSQKFAIDEETKKLLLPQSITGHALFGHSSFIDENGKSLVFADATIEKVIAALSDVLEIKNPKEIGVRRENFLKEVYYLMNRAFQEEKIELHDRNGCPLLGVDFLKGKLVRSSDFLKGFYLGAMMDNYHFRMKTNRRYPLCLNGFPFKMGGGEIYLINKERFELAGLRPRDLSDKEISSEDIQKLKEHKIISSYGEVNKPEMINSIYIRRKEGSGICDDAAMIYIAKKFGNDAYWGAFVADACDTYDKYLAHYQLGGYDEYYAEQIRQFWFEKHHEEIINDKDLLEIIFIAAEDNYPKIGFSSSHRRLVQYEKDGKYPTAVEHLRFVIICLVDNVLLGFERFPSDEFYKILKTRADVLRLDYW